MTMGGSLPAVDVQEAARRLADDPDRPVLIDVREPDEFEDVRAPDAALMPTSTFLLKMGDLPVDRPLLIICRSGSRSAAVTAYLQRNGRTDVANVSGGMDAWQRAGLPVRHGPVGPDEGQLPSE